MEFRRGSDVGHCVHFVEVKLVHAAGRYVDKRNVEKDIAILAYIWFTPYKSKCSIRKINNSSPSIKL